MTAISVSNLSKSYGTTRALSDISLQVQSGEVVGLLGPNGAGKTTLMKILTGYLQPDDGSAAICGHNIETETIAAQTRLGYLPENVPLYTDMTVAEYLGSVAELRQLAPADIGDAVAAAIIDTGLQQYYNKPIRTLSKGYRQRVGIAQAILHRPDLLILDEPTTGLDPNQIVEIRKLIAKLATRSTIVLSTHILSEVEATCQRVIIIDSGQLRADGTINELLGTTTQFVVTTRGAADISADLKQLETIDRVEVGAKVDGYRSYTVSGPSGEHELGESIFSLAVEKNWKLVELTKRLSSLEQVFRKVAGKDAES